MSGVRTPHRPPEPRERSDMNDFGNQNFTGPDPHQRAPWTYQQQYLRGPGMSEKSKIVAGLYGIFLGLFGVHNFYLGNTGRGICQLLLTLVGWACVGVGPIVSLIWSLVEGINILASHPGSKWHLDAEGMQLQD
ncbi:MAG: TM2 domain-containing protein [Aeriscardovia sp.]|nr:TM2 domain-containing protein [Aeriscardovia sp.]